MLDGKVFYWGTTRKLVSAFGSIFNNIYVVRSDNQDVEQYRIQVPLTYASRNAYIAKIHELARDGGQATHSLTLPRMGFALESMAYDPSRKTNTLNKVQGGVENGGDIKKMLVPVPYNYNFSLTIYTKHIEDSLQIIEQIVPYFAPEMNMSIVDVEELGIVSDVPLILNNITFEDNFENAFDDNRLISFQLDFEARGYMYPPLSDSGVIRKSIGRFKDFDNQTGIEDVTMEVDSGVMYEDGLTDDDITETIEIAIE